MNLNDEMLPASLIRDKVVLITGAGAGIGAALAERFTADGAKVVGCDLPSNLAAVEATGCAFSSACDVTRPENMDALVKATMEKFGRIDGVVANAGIAVDGVFDEIDWEDIEKVFRVNIFGVLHTIRAVAPVMRAQKYGRIAVAASRNAQSCKFGRIGYNSSKAAVVTAVGTIARELAGTGILANCYIPGLTRTAIRPLPDGNPPGTCYPTVRRLLSLPEEGPSGRTFFGEDEIQILQPLSKEMLLSIDETAR
ncbi:SDR family NAD(P)-dependent oxidoreductase [Oceanibium sediminis]|uniref:SDR family NAD(P)-dependent oxidoreductase n=1 Tax=Oceanibium sediminis TaxID=2026339 RepID=UPI000DD2FA3A|nr:SDR family oxidoreductase [Oceanibium sediminis]